MMCGDALPLLVRAGASCRCRRMRLLVLWPISDGLRPFQQLPASEMSRRWGCDGWQSIDPPHLAALLSDDGGNHRHGWALGAQKNGES
jgi:hypothetical protein